MNASIILQGGLGNRLFQTAFIYAYGRKWNKKISIHSEHPNPHTHTDYQKLIYSSIPKNIKLNNPIQFKEPWDKCISYLEIPNFEKDCIFHGYYQCEKYFKEYRKEILNLFHIPQQNKYLISPKSIFVHVRRGDYVNNSFHHLDLEKYYITAIKDLKNKYSSDFILYVISDDIHYCKKSNLFQNLYSNIIYVEDLDEIESLSLMLDCKMGGICSNSTFSWWGGYLIESEDKSVYFPSMWFNKEHNGNYKNEIAFIGSYIIDLDTSVIKINNI
jgi:hypothetical protein